MPLIYENVLPADIRFAVWEITDQDKQLWRANTIPGKENLSLINEEKSFQSIAARAALSYLLGNEIQLTKTEIGKPVLANSLLEVSLSHTNTVAIAAVSSFEIGIDIELPRPQLAKVAGKFLNIEELGWIDIRNLNILAMAWAAKEALFKLYGKGAVDFKTHLLLSPFCESDKYIKAYIYKHDKQHCDIYFDKIADHRLAIANYCR